MPNLKIKITYTDSETQHPFSFEQDGECSGFIELPEAVYKTVYKSLSKTFGEYKFKELVEKPKPKQPEKIGSIRLDAVVAEVKESPRERPTPKSKGQVVAKRPFKKSGK